MQEKEKKLLKGVGSSHSEVLLKKAVLKICRKFTGEHPCRSIISIKLYCNFVEIAIWHGCSPVNLLHIFRTPFYKNTSEWLFLRCPIKRLFWKTLQNSQENISVGVYFSIKLKALPEILVKMRLRHMCSPMDYLKQFRKAFLKITSVRLVLQKK